LFRSHDIFLMTSRSEAFGTVVTEAMASGTPVIATNIISIRNIITNGYNGFLVDSEPERFAEAIKILVENPSIYRKFINNGLKTSKIYNWDMVIDKYEKLYFSLLHNINR
jgi:glycosyltransferase involved in cell wall biosynthesis